MDMIRARAGELRRGLVLLALYALVVGTFSVVSSMNLIVDGDVVGIIRAAIGILGVAAAVLIWTGGKVGVDGHQLVMAWAWLQLPVIAFREGGNPFMQGFDFPLAMVSQSTETINGEVVSSEFNQFGINLVAIAILIVVYRTRERWNISQRQRAEATPESPAASSA